MPSISVSWTGGVDASVYIDTPAGTLGPYNSNSYTSVSVPDDDGSYLVRPWCGGNESANYIAVSGGVAVPNSISCEL
jgi:hypothetical protein